MSKVLVTESYLSDISNSIRAKTKSTTKYKPSEMAKAIDSIPLGDPAIVVNSDSPWRYTVSQKEHENLTVKVGHELIGNSSSGYQAKLVFTPSVSSNYGYNAGTVRRTADEKNHIANFTVDDATEVAGLLKDGWAGIYAFAFSSDSSSVSHYFNNYNNHNTSKVSSNTSIENLLILGYYTEDSKGNLVAKTQKNVAEYKPSSQVSLKKYQNKYATSIDDSAFYSCPALTSVDIPNATSVGTSAFGNCSALTTVDLLNVTKIGYSAFSGCSGLITIDLPNATSIDNAAFQDCSALTSVDFSNVASIGAYAFQRDYALRTIFLHSKTMCTCVGDPWVNSSVTIYVPKSLIDSYKAATYWSKYSSQFKTIESLSLSKISIIGSSKINTYNGNTTGTYKVQYNDGVVLPEQVGVTWSITGNATISKDGVVTLKNASVGDKLTITATSTYNTSISASLTVSIVNVATSMTVDLNNGQWVDSGTTVDGHTVYKSDAGSYHVNSGSSTCTVTVKGYNKATVYVRSYAEGNYDYVDVGPLDGTVTRSNEVVPSVLTTRGRQSATQYYSHTFETNDGNTHTFQVMYSKDASGNNDDDRGYFYVVCE